MTEQGEGKPRDRRIVMHVKALQEAGQDTKAFVEALAAIKNDANLNDAQRGAILKTLAQNMALTYSAILSPKGPPPPSGETA